MNSKKIKYQRLLFPVLLFIFNLTYSQTPVNIYTPNGSFVTDTYLTPELSQGEVASWESWMQQNYPNATILELGTVSGTYNCHGYAWYVSEGGERVWIGYYFYTSEDIFWWDGSYIEELAQSSGQKVSYLPDVYANHSALTTTTNNVFISKWGDGPKVQHAHDYCPYWNDNWGMSFKFYRREQNPGNPSGSNLLSNKQKSFFESF